MKGKQLEGYASGYYDKEVVGGSDICVRLLGSLGWEDVWGVL